MHHGPSPVAKPQTAAAKVFWLLVLRIPEALLAALIAILVLFLTVSVFARYALNIGLAWSDEASRLLFIWTVFIGYAVGVRHRAHIGVDFVVDRMPRRGRRVVETIQDIAILVFSILFTWQSYVTVKFSFLQRMPGLDVSIAWLYFAVLVAGVLMTIYAIFNLWDTLNGKRVAPDAMGAEALRISE